MDKSVDYSSPFCQIGNTSLSILTPSFSFISTSYTSDFPTAQNTSSGQNLCEHSSKNTEFYYQKDSNQCIPFWDCRYLLSYTLKHTKSPIWQKHVNIASSDDGYNTAEFFSEALFQWRAVIASFQFSLAGFKAQGTLIHLE